MTDRKRRRSIVTGGTGAAAKTVILLAAMFEFAKTEGLVAGNPARGSSSIAGLVTRDKVVPDLNRLFFLALGEIQRIGFIGSNLVRVAFHIPDVTVYLVPK